MPQAVQINEIAAELRGALPPGVADTLDAHFDREAAATKCTVVVKRIPLDVDIANGEGEWTGEKQTTYYKTLCFDLTLTGPKGGNWDIELQDLVWKTVVCKLSGVVVGKAYHCSYKTGYTFQPFIKVRWSEGRDATLEGEVVVSRS